MKDPQIRKAENENKIRALGAAINKHLPLVESSNEVILKSLDEICERTVAAMLTIQIAIDSGKGEYDESVKFMGGLIDKFGVKGSLNEMELKVFEGKSTPQENVNVVWEYECCWSLFWALGLIDGERVESAGEICDCNTMISLINDYSGMEEFKSKCRLRDIEEILDMLDLFYRFHWVCTDNRIRPKTPVGGLNEEIVMERRRGLEWLVSDEDDWFDISLDT